MEIFFFDAIGALWVTCDPGCPFGWAFGPTGCSMFLHPDFVGLHMQPGETARAAAARTGRLLLAGIDHDGEWDLLVD